MQIALYKNAAATDLLTILTVPEAQAVIAGYGNSRHYGEFTIGTDQYDYFGQNNPGIYQGSFIPNNFWGEAMAGWLLPDPDNEDHYIYTSTGARIKYTHVLSGSNGVFTMYYPEPLDGNTYKTLISAAYPMIVYTYVRAQYRPILYFGYAPKAHCLEWDNTIVKTGSALIAFVRSQIVGTGSLTDPDYQAIAEVTLFDTSTISPVYKPTKNTRRGGTGTGTYHGAVNGERPNIATRNSTTTFGGSGDGLTYYQLGSINGLHRCINYAYEMGVLRDNQYLRDAMVSAYILPVLTITSTAASGVRIADNTINDFDPLMSIQIFDQAHISDMQSCYYDFGELDGWGDKLDFTNTQLTLFLPFVGSVNIDINACMYNRLEVDYCIDVYNGNIIYYVYTNSLETDTDTLYGTYTGNCAIDIPLCGAGQSGSVLGRITNAVSSLAVGAASIAAGNPMTAAGAALGMVDAVVPTYKVDRSGAIDVNGSCLSPYRISLKISQPVELRADTQYNVGRAAYFDCTFSDLPAGKHIISAVEVDGISTATSAEQEQIKQILMRGVYVK